MAVSGVSNQATIAFSNLKAGTETEMMKKTLEKQDTAALQAQNQQKVQTRDQVDTLKQELQAKQAAEDAALTGKGQKINIKI